MRFFNSITIIRTHTQQGQNMTRRYKNVWTTIIIIVEEKIRMILKKVKIQNGAIFRTNIYPEHAYCMYMYGEKGVCMWIEPLPARNRARSDAVSCLALKTKEKNWDEGEKSRLGFDKRQL